MNVQAKIGVARGTTGMRSTRRASLVLVEERGRRKPSRLPLLLFLLSLAIVGVSFWCTVRLVNTNISLQKLQETWGSRLKGEFQGRAPAPAEKNDTSIPADFEALSAFYNIPSDGTNLWDKNPGKLASWQIQYLNWHKDKRQSLAKDNASWKTQRFLVMQCLLGQDQKKCGGTADRLKPLPWAIRMAYLTRRILVIRWTRPAPLESFLLPPSGGREYSHSDDGIILEYSIGSVWYGMVPYHTIPYNIMTV
jgi:hypothetical protein